MQLKEINIQNYRSIKDITIKFPDGKPVILFGENNAGKSNILSALDVFLGKKYPLYLDITDSDYRKGTKEPINIIGTFSEKIPGVRPYLPQYWDTSRKVTIRSKEMAVPSPIYDTNSMYHHGIPMENIDTNKIGLLYSKYKKLQDGYVNYPERYFYSPSDDGNMIVDVEENSWRNWSSIMLNANDDLSQMLNHENKNSIINQIFQRLLDSPFVNLENLKEHLDNLKNILGIEIQLPIESLLSLVNNSMEGFAKIDFSLYNPSHVLQDIHFIFKSENGNESINTLGSGERQVIALSLLVAYIAQVGGFYLIIIDEPETHLHPLAQKWLKEYIKTRVVNPISDVGQKLQFIIATHSPYFLDPNFMEGFVHVYKENGTTCVTQVLADSLKEDLIKYDTDLKLSNYLPTILSEEYLKGFFSNTILLVEGDSEEWALPKYFENGNTFLYRHGIEIVQCHGKENIENFWKIYTDYNYKCYVIFDYDKKFKEESNKKVGNKPADYTTQNRRISEIFPKLPKEEEVSFDVSAFDLQEEYGYFNVNFDEYLKSYLKKTLKSEGYEVLMQYINKTYGCYKKPRLPLAIAHFLTSSILINPEIRTIPFIDKLEERLLALSRMPLDEYKNLMESERG